MSAGDRDGDQITLEKCAVFAVGGAVQGEKREEVRDAAPEGVGGYLRGRKFRTLNWLAS